MLNVATHRASLIAVLRVTYCQHATKSSFIQFLMNCCSKGQIYFWTHLARRWDKIVEGQRLNLKMSWQSLTLHASLGCEGHVEVTAFSYCGLALLCCIPPRSTMMRRRIDRSTNKRAPSVCQPDREGQNFYKRGHICVFCIDRSAMCRINRWLVDGKRRGGGYCSVMSCRSCVVAAGW